jgi:hypothetical protein
LGAEILQTPAMLFNDGRRGAIHERSISQFLFDRAHFGFDSGNFLIKPPLFPGSIGGGNGQKDLA